MSAENPIPQAVVPAQKPIVFSLHGIRTWGPWQKDLSKELSNAGFQYIPLDYGWFSSVKFLLPYKRQQYVEWFRDEYAKHVRDIVPSVIAHSFGSYLVARSMQQFPEIKFDRIILCGSIVQVGYPWKTLHQENRFVALLNEIGRSDPWGHRAEWVVEDAGPSGAQGFSEKGNWMTERIHPEFRHSSFFYASNYQKNWVPFLQGTPPLTTGTAGKPYRNWKATIVKWLFWLLVAIALFIGGWLAWSYFHEPAPVATPISISEFMEKKSKLGPTIMQDDYLGKVVTWTGVVHDVTPDHTAPTYTMKPKADSLMSEWVSAIFQPKDFVKSVEKGQTITVQGEIKTIGPALVQLKNCKLVTGGEPPHSSTEVPTQ